MYIVILTVIKKGKKQMDKSGLTILSSNIDIENIGRPKNIDISNDIGF